MWKLAVCLVIVNACADETRDPAPVTCEGALVDPQLNDVVDTTFFIGPNISHTTTTSATIVWETTADCPTGGSVAFGVHGGSLDQTATVEQIDLIRRATLSGLEANTVYDYQVSACDQQTTTLSFATAPPPTAPVRFTVFGDTQSPTDITSTVAAAMKSQKPHFVLHVGDEISDDTNHASWQTELWAPLRPLAHQIPMYAAIGNHEDNTPDYYAYHTYPFAHLHDQQRAFYAFRYGTVFVLAIDTTDVFFALASFDESSEVNGWIHEQLTSEAARTARWRIAIGHYPAYSEGWGHCDESSYDGFLPVADWLMPLMSENGFHAYFAGHTHGYERGRSHGVLHIISGGGGGALDQWCRELPETELYAYEHHHVTVDATCDAMTLQAVNVDGAILDTVTLTP